MASVGVAAEVSCVLSVQVLQSFKIMDYSMLLAVHNIDQADRDKVSLSIRQVHILLPREIFTFICNKLL